MPPTAAIDHVSAGQPVTAQGWNAIVDGLLEVKEAIAAKGAAVPVAVTGNALDIAAAHVFATNVAGVRLEAVPPSQGGQPFLFPQLAPGAYTILVTAPDCKEGNGSVTVAEDGTASPATVTVPLVFDAARMPKVIAKAWHDAATDLGDVNVRALDCAGRGVPLTGYDSSYADVPVLTQWPGPQEVLPKGAQALVVVAAPQVRPLVVTPDLTGKTVPQAQALLAPLGLELRFA